MKTQTPRPIRLKDYRPPPYLIDEVALDVGLDPTRTLVRNTMKVRANPAVRGHGGPLVLDGEMFELNDFRVNASAVKKAEYDVDEATLTLHRVPSTSPFTIDVTTVVNPEQNKALSGLYRSRGIYCTQCEAEGFRRITYALDRPDVLSTYRVRLSADAEQASVLLANGNPVERGMIGGGRHYAVWHDPHPKPCYLFALVGGNLASIASTFTTMSGREVDLRIYVEPGKEDRAHWAMDALKRAMRWDEQRFGREYDLEVFNVVAVSDFNMGAMENKGLNIFNDQLILASPETATDASFEAIESVVAHEYFHNWTGNRITCRDWFQLCLKEGLTVYRDQEFSADERSRPVQRITDVRHLKASQFPEDAGPLAHPVRPKSYIEINNFYTPTVYEKGAELVRMMETIVGAAGFRAGMDLYFERHDGRAATVEDFVACIAEATGADLSQFVRWYGQAGTPQLVCRLDYDKSANTAELTIKQINPPTPGERNKAPLHIPVRIGLISGNGQELALKLEDGSHLTNNVLQLTRPKQTFRFIDVPTKPVPSLLRGFSAPVKLTSSLSERDLEFLMVHDSDLFNRWQAVNDYATRTVIHLVRARMAGKRSSKGLGFAQALAVILRDAALDPAYVAELLRLPSEADIARELDQGVDPGAIHAARRQLLRKLGNVLGDQLELTYAANATRGPFSPDANSAGRRAARNMALSLLAARDKAEDRQRQVDHYFQATNMTDEAHALYLIAAGRMSRREEVLAHFCERWKDDHLVIDTWFRAQAISPLPQTIDRLQRLLKHPLFSLSTPNKVRALIGSFASLNQLQFNRPDGAGYKFVAGQVLAIDKFNPQVAARLLAAFRSWQMLEPGRKQRARRVLKGVAATKGLSRDVFEIAHKILE